MTTREEARRLMETRRKHFSILFKAGSSISQIAYIMGTDNNDVRYHLKKIGLYNPQKKV